MKRYLLIIACTMITHLNANDTPVLKEKLAAFLREKKIQPDRFNNDGTATILWNQKELTLISPNDCHYEGHIYKDPTTIIGILECIALSKKVPDIETLSQKILDNLEAVD